MEHTQLITSIVVALLASSGFWTYIQTRYMRKSHLETAVKVLVADRILQECAKHIRVNATTCAQRRLLGTMYKTYIGMGDGDEGVNAVWEQYSVLKLVSDEEYLQRVKELHIKN